MLLDVGAVMTNVEDKEAKTAHRAIHDICRAWEVSLARFSLECLEAGDDAGVAAACTRSDEREDRLFDELMTGKPTTLDDIAGILKIVMRLMKDELRDRERVLDMLQLARQGISDINHAADVVRWKAEDAESRQ